jgi:hypothetical protein
MSAKKRRPKPSKKTIEKESLRALRKERAKVSADLRLVLEKQKAVQDRIKRLDFEFGSYASLRDEYTELRMAVRFLVPLALAVSDMLGSDNDYLTVRRFREGLSGIVDNPKLNPPRTP